MNATGNESTRTTGMREREYENYPAVIPGIEAMDSGDLEGRATMSLGGVREFVQILQAALNNHLDFPYDKIPNCLLCYADDQLAELDAIFQELFRRIMQAENHNDSTISAA